MTYTATSDIHDIYIQVSRVLQEFLALYQFPGVVFQEFQGVSRSSGHPLITTISYTKDTYSNTWARFCQKNNGWIKLLLLVECISNNSKRSKCCSKSYKSQSHPATCCLRHQYFLASIKYIQLKCSVKY